MNKLRAILVYYIQILPVTFICSVLACKTIHTYGWEVFSKMFWSKIVVSLLAFYFNDVFRGREIYFYYNLGVKKPAIWGSVLFVDTVIFILMLILFFKPV